MLLPIVSECCCYCEYISNKLECIEEEKKEVQQTKQITLGTWNRYLSAKNNTVRPEMCLSQAWPGVGMSPIFLNVWVLSCMVNHVAHLFSHAKEDLPFQHSCLLPVLWNEQLVLWVHQPKDPTYIKHINDSQISFLLFLIGNFWSM